MLVVLTVVLTASWSSRRNGRAGGGQLGLEAAAGNSSRKRTHAHDTAPPHLSAPRRPSTPLPPLDLHQTRLDLSAPLSAHSLRTQMNPVAASAAFCVNESLSAGRARSLMPAMTRAHLASGAQKKMVLKVGRSEGSHREVGFGSSQVEEQAGNQSARSRGSRRQHTSRQADRSCSLGPGGVVHKLLELGRGGVRGRPGNLRHGGVVGGGA